MCRDKEIILTNEEIEPLTLAILKLSFGLKTSVYKVPSSARPTSLASAVKTLNHTAIPQLHFFYSKVSMVTQYTACLRITLVVVFYLVLVRSFSHGAHLANLNCINFQPVSACIIQVFR